MPSHLHVYCSILQPQLITPFLPGLFELIYDCHFSHVSLAAPGYYSICQVIMSPLPLKWLKTTLQTFPPHFREQAFAPSFV